MPANRDLVEAQAYHRRRFLAAFVCGGPGSREVVPSRSGRTVVGGVTLAALLVAGAAIADLLSPGTPDDWAAHGLVVSRETAQAYVVLPDAAGQPQASGGRVDLRPVANITSARLVLGADVEPVLVPQDTIDDQAVGGEIGILGAPADLPGPGGLVGSGWVACAADGRRVGVRVPAEPGVDPLPQAGQVVRVGREAYLVATVQAGDEPPAAYALRLPDRAAADYLLGDLGLPARALAPRVPRGWLDLFPVGAPLDAAGFGLEGVGGRPADWTSAGVPARARVGDVLTDAAGHAVLLTADGPADLDPFAFAVYRHSLLPDRRPPALISVRALPDLTKVGLPLADAHWPAAAPAPLAGEPCAVLVTDGDAPAVVRLGPRDSTVAAAGAVVDPGHAAYVLVRPAPARDARPVVIDGAGRAHRLVGEDAADTAARLGYADYRAPVVPADWVRLFEPGVPLSRERALCPVAATADRRDPSRGRRSR